MTEKRSTEEKILRASKELFIKNGYHDTSMSAIAQKAGFGKGTLYWYFDGKDKLFQAMVTREGEIILDELNNLKDSSSNAEEILKEFIKMRLERMIKHKKTSQMFLDEENFMKKDFRKTMFEIMQSFIEMLTNTIKQGIEEDLFYTDNPQKTAAAFMGMINGVCSNTILKSGYKNFDVEENVDFIYNLFLNGLKYKGGENN